jgi:hypothetical protein
MTKDFLDELQSFSFGTIVGAFIFCLFIFLYFLFVYIIL